MQKHHHRCIGLNTKQLVLSSYSSSVPVQSCVDRPGVFRTLSPWEELVGSLLLLANNLPGTRRINKLGLDIILLVAPEKDTQKTLYDQLTNTICSTSVYVSRLTGQQLAPTADGLPHFNVDAFASSRNQTVTARSPHTCEPIFTPVNDTHVGRR